MEAFMVWLAFGFGIMIGAFLGIIALETVRGIAQSRRAAAGLVLCTEALPNDSCLCRPGADGKSAGAGEPLVKQPLAA